MEPTRKAIARQALRALGLPAAQYGSARRAVARATTRETFDIVRAGTDVIVRLSRPGREGFQVIEAVVRSDGTKSVIQTAYDATGELVHFDPKLP